MVGLEFNTCQLKGNYNHRRQQPTAVPGVRRCDHNPEPGGCVWEYRLKLIKDCCMYEASISTIVEKHNVVIRLQ